MTSSVAIRVGLDVGRCEGLVVGVVTELVAVALTDGVGDAEVAGALVLAVVVVPAHPVRVRAAEATMTRTTLESLRMFTCGACSQRCGPGSDWSALARRPWTGCLPRSRQQCPPGP
jgi:hypothetical protein